MLQGPTPMTIVIFGIFHQAFVAFLKWWRTATGLTLDNSGDKCCGRNPWEEPHRKPLSTLLLGGNTCVMKSFLHHINDVINTSRDLGSINSHTHTSVQRRTLLGPDWNLNPGPWCSCSTSGTLLLTYPAATSSLFPSVQAHQTLHCVCLESVSFVAESRPCYRSVYFGQAKKQTVAFMLKDLKVSIKFSHLRGKSRSFPAADKESGCCGCVKQISVFVFAHLFYL